MTLHDISEYLKTLDEVTLLELLDISSEEIVDRFQDLIEEKADDIEADLEDQDE